MKSVIISFLFCIVLIVNTLGQESAEKNDSVEIIQDHKNLYRYQNFYLGGQPTLETLLWLKSRV